MNDIALKPCTVDGHFYFNGMDKKTPITAILVGGEEDENGRVIENVTCSNIWTAFSEFKSTGVTTSDGKVIYMFDRSKCK